MFEGKLAESFRTLDLPKPFEINQIQQYGEVFEITFEKPLKIEAAPGQYGMFSMGIPGAGEKPFMIANPDPFKIWVNPVGPFSKDITSGQVPTLYIRGPKGTGFTKPDESELSDGSKLSFIITNTAGISSLNFLINRLSRKLHRHVNVILTKEILQKFGAASAFINFAHFVLPENTLQDSLQGLLANSSHIYMDKLFQIEESPTLKRAQALNLDTYFRCSMGICGSCEYKGLFMCTEGPVVDLLR